MKTKQMSQCAVAHNLSTPPPLPTTGFLRLPHVLAVFPVSRSTWWAGVKSGKYPKAVKLGQRTTAWSAESIQALIDRVAKDAGGTI